MNSRSKHLPWDLLILLYSPLIFVPVSFAFWIVSLIGPMNAAVILSAGVALLGTVLLFLAKLPAYRGGMLSQAGYRHLPLTSQRLYRQAYSLILPGGLALIALTLLFKKL